MHIEEALHLRNFAKGFDNDISIYVNKWSHPPPPKEIYKYNIMTSVATN
jgi:hypothetical protein